MIAAAVLQHFGKRAIVRQRRIQSACAADIALSEMKFLRQILFAARHIHKLSVLSAVDMYQSRFLLLIQMKCRVPHPKRLKNVHFIILRSVHAGNDFDHARQHVKPSQRRISCAASGLKIQRVLRIPLRLCRKIDPLPTVFQHGKQTDHSLLQPRGMGQQIADRDLPLCRNRFYTFHPEKQRFLQKLSHFHAVMPSISRVICNARLCKRRNKQGKGIVKIQHSGLHQLQNADGRDAFGHGHHAENRILLNRRSGRLVSISPAVPVSRLSMLLHKQ